MANPVTVGDLEDRWRPLTPAQQVNAQACLDDVWAVLLSKRSIEADMTAGTVLPGVVVAAVTAVALRVLKNPDGKGEVAIDDYRYKRHELMASGLIQWTDEELGWVTPNGGPSAAFTITPYGAPDDAVWEAWL